MYLFCLDELRVLVILAHFLKSKNAGGKKKWEKNNFNIDPAFF